MTSHVAALALWLYSDAKVARSSWTAAVWIAAQIELLAVMNIWNSGIAKLMRTAPISRRGSNIRALYCVETPCPHITRYEAQRAMRTIAAFATIWSLGSKRWMVALPMKSRP